MNVYRTLVYGLAGGAAGVILGTDCTSILAAILRMSSREGGPGFFAVGIGFLAGLAGFSRGSSTRSIRRASRSEEC